MSEVERYLQRATWGLWGRKRQEVREELETHIQERIVAHRIAGLSEKNAVERTLSEMGEPREVSEGMTRIYTLPTLLGSGVFFAAACAIVVVTFSDGSAQSLPLDYRWPAEICLEASAQNLPEKCKADEPWLSVEELKENLGPLGVGVTEQGDDTILSFPNAQPVRLPPLDIKPADYGSSAGTETLNTFLRSEQLREGYYPLYAIVFQIASQADVPVRLEGWENPTLQVGDAAFQLGTEAQPLQDMFLFGLLFMPLIDQPSFPEFIESTGLTYTAWDDGDGSSKYNLESQRFEVGAEEGERYFVAAFLEPTPDDVARLEREVDNTTLWYDIARGNADGTVNLRLPNEVTFVEKISEQPEVNTAVLIRLTDTFVPYRVATEREGGEVAGLDYGIVSPTQIRAVEEAQ